MTKPPKTTLTMAGNSRRPAAGRGPAQPPRGRQPGRGGEPPPRAKSSSKRRRGASVERRKAENIFENLAQSSVSSSDSESDKASKASSKKSRAEFKDTKMAEKEDILSILGDDSSEYTSNDEEEYDQAADAHKLQQSSEEEEEQEDEEEGFYPEEEHGEEKEEEEDQRREEPDDPGTEDDETAKDDARQNPGTDNLLEDSSVSSTDPFTAETEVSGVKVKTSEAISVYVRPPTVVEIVNSVEYSRWKKITRPCKCGSCTHKTTRSDACPLNKGRLQADALLKGTSVPKLTSVRQKKGAKDVITAFKMTIGYQQLVKGIAREAYSEAQASSRTQSARTNTATPPPANDERKVGDNYLKFLTLEELIVTETQLKKKERRASKMAKVNRTHFLQDLAEARAKDGKTTAAKALAQLQLEEESRQSHRRVKAVNGKLRSAKPLVLYKRLVDDDGIETTVALDTKAEQEKEALWHFAERCQV